MTTDELCEEAFEVVIRDVEIQFIHATGACWWPADECPYWRLHDSRLERRKRNEL